jgi:HEPN domain-containing protein
VIDKALKGFFAETKKQTPPFKHNLTLLSEKCGLYDSMSAEQKELLDMLEPLQVEARYPTYKKKLLESLNEGNCSRLVVQTEELMSWVKGKLPR